MSSRAIRLPRSILFQIGGLVLAAIASVVLISFGVVMLTPEPPTPRMMLSEVRAALLNGRKASEFGLQRSVSAEPPLASTANEGRLFAIMLASSLDVPLENVRFTTRSSNPSANMHAPARVPVARLEFRNGEAPGAAHVVTHTNPAPKRGAEPPPVSGEIRTPAGALARQPVIAVFSANGAPEPIVRPLHPNDPSLLTRVLLSRPFAMADYQASYRQQNGSWVTVEPKKPWLSLWQKRLLLTLALSALVMAPLAWLAARRLTRPIRELANFADRAELGERAAPAPADAPREIAAAANAITEMRARLQEEASGRGRMLAAVAHDMRTPLTGLRLRAETAPPEERERMAADIARMEKMIGQVLAYSSGEQSDEPHEPFDLDSLVEECVRDARAQGQDATFRPGEEVEVTAAPLGLHRAIRNLLDNAHRYGGACEVRVEADGECASVIVEDRGPGIPENLLQKVQEPFFREEKSRNRDTGGTGLGLAITSTIARQHGGKLLLSNRPDGGLRVELRIRR